ncbi:SGNH/GDSL hydrolase family protein (plasmid) [Coraliomargarita sp. W4R53]
MNSPLGGQPSMREVSLIDGGLLIKGAVWIEPTEAGVFPRRYAPEAGDRIVDDFMGIAMRQSTGVRIAFRTAASNVHLRVFATKLVDSLHAPMLPAVYDLWANGAVVATASSVAGVRQVMSDRGIDTVVAGEEDTLSFSLDGKERDYELWLPYTDEVELRGFAADATVSAPRESATKPRWVHHGSSISHGYIASRTTKTWPAQVANSQDLELINLSYSGNAMLDQSTARTIRDTPAEAITLKLGINVVNGDIMRLRAFRSALHGFLDTIRDGHPETPLLVVSPIYCPPVESVPGPTLRDESIATPWTITLGRREEIAEGKLSLEVVRHEIAAIVAQRSVSDHRLAYLDGTELYGARDNATLPMPDNLHPADDVNDLIAQRFAEIAFGTHGWLPRTSVTREASAHD